MKKINTSSITSTKGLIFEKKQIDFLQENTRYVNENILYTALGEKNLNAVILWGCVPTFSTSGGGFANDTLTITEGAIQYNGTIYRVDAQTVTRLVIGNTHYLEIAPVDTSEGNPSTFTDSTTANTQENTKIRLAQGLSGGGIVDWVNVQRVSVNDVQSGNPTGLSPIFTAIRSQSQPTITNVATGSENITAFATKKDGFITITAEVEFQADAGVSINLGRLQLDLSTRYQGVFDDVNTKLSISGMARTTNSATPPTHIYIDSVDDSNNISNSILRITTLGLTVFPSANAQATIFTFQMSYKAKNNL